jgi:hypothetical protein
VSLSLHVTTHDTWLIAGVVSAEVWRLGHDALCALHGTVQSTFFVGSYRLCLGFSLRRLRDASDPLNAKAEPDKEDSMTRAVIPVAFALLLFAAPDAAQFTDWSAPLNLGPLVNSAYTDGCVCVSKSGLSLFFFSNRYALNSSAPLHMYVSRRDSIDAPWGEPEELVDFNDGLGASCPALSPDEHRLFFVTSRTGGCGGSDIWVSRRHNRRDDFGWEPPVNLGCMPDGPNSPEGESVPTVFEDDTGTEVLYFSSTRPGGPGGADIYESRMGIGDAFGPANVVAELSSTVTDYVAVRRDGLEVIISSPRPGGNYAGTHDLWTATRESTEEPWLEPVVIPILNSSSNEGARMGFSFDGRWFYFRSNRPGGYGDYDLYVTTREKLRR